MLSRSRCRAGPTSCWTFGSGRQSAAATSLSRSAGDRNGAGRSQSAIRRIGHARPCLAQACATISRPDRTIRARLARCISIHRSSRATMSFDRKTFAALLSLSAAYFTLGTGSLAVIALVPPMAADLGTSPAAIANLLTAFALTFALAAPLSQVLLGHLPRRTLLLGGLVVMSLASIAGAFAWSYGVLARHPRGDGPGRGHCRSDGPGGRGRTDAPRAAGARARGRVRRHDAGYRAGHPAVGLAGRAGRLARRAAGDRAGRPGGGGGRVPPGARHQRGRPGQPRHAARGAGAAASGLERGDHACCRWPRSSLRMRCCCRISPTAPAWLPRGARSRSSCSASAGSSATSLQGGSRTVSVRTAPSPSAWAGLRSPSWV